MVVVGRRKDELPDDLLRFLQELEAKYYGEGAQAAGPPPPLPREALDGLIKALEQRAKSQAAALIDLARAAEFWKDPTGEGWATVPVGEHREHHSVRSRAFRRWLAGRYYRETGSPPGDRPLRDALDVLEGMAVHDGPEHPTYLRVAERAGRIYLDLADGDWRAVEIGPEGWRVMASHDLPVRFRRGRGMQPLPEPVRGGDLRLLRRYLYPVRPGDPLPAPDDPCWADPPWVLTVAFLVAALNPGIPYPVLPLTGEQGSGKSTRAQLLRSLLDPNSVPLRTLPREERDLAVAAHHSWCIVLDNVSGLAPWVSDALCRLATGGGFGTRTLYENDDEFLFAHRRPVILTGIEDVVTRADLLDRSLLVTLPPIEDALRRPEGELWAAWEADRPRVLGALLDAVAEGLRRLPDLRLDRLPRMADFAKWVVACEAKLPWQPGTFLRVYEGNRRDAVTTALDVDPVGTAVREWLPTVTGGTWSGTAAALLDLLTARVGERVAKSREWPQTARGLSGRLRRLAPALRAVGITIDFERLPGGSSGGARTRILTLEVGPPAKKEAGSEPSPSSPSSPQPEQPAPQQGLSGGTVGAPAPGGTVPPPLPTVPPTAAAGGGTNPGDGQGTVAQAPSAATVPPNGACHDAVSHGMGDGGDEGDGSVPTSAIEHPIEGAYYMPVCLPDGSCHLCAGREWVRGRDGRWRCRYCLLTDEDEEAQAA